MAINRDFSDLLSTFNAREVRFLIVGSYAVTFHSRPRFTKDLDLWIDPTPDNASRAFRALAEFGAPLGGVSPADFATPGVIFQMGIPPNRIDVLTKLDGVDFDGAWTRRAEGRYGSIRVGFLSREDLVRNKRAVGRPQDLLDLEALEGPPAPPAAAPPDPAEP